MRNRIFLLSVIFCVVGLLGSYSHVFAQQIILGQAYGEIVVDTSNAISVDAFFDDFDNQDSIGIYTIRGTIVKTCKRAGCWIAIDKELPDEKDYFIVRFKDHFTIPTDTPSGTIAFLHGTAYWEVTSIEELRKIAKKNGESEQEIQAIIEPQYSFGFEADGIVLVK